MAPSVQEISSAPLYVPDVSEPFFIQSPITEDAQLPKGGNFKPYCPGAMLAESAFMTSTFGDQFVSPSSPYVATGSELNDPGTESDCSTTDTANEAMTSMQSEAMTSMQSMQMAASDAGFMAMMAENSWNSYAAAGYWGMPYAPPAPVTSFPAQSAQTWSQQMPYTSAQTYVSPSAIGADMNSAGSNGHRLGRCKPCAFMYKDGCRSGADCPYCHLCPPGEKQRRKRVMRSMQRNMTPQ